MFKFLERNNGRGPKKLWESRKGSFQFYLKRNFFYLVKEVGNFDISHRVTLMPYKDFEEQIISRVLNEKSINGIFYKFQMPWDPEIASSSYDVLTDELVSEYVKRPNAADPDDILIVRVSTLDIENTEKELAKRYAWTYVRNAGKPDNYTVEPLMELAEKIISNMALLTQDPVTGKTFRVGGGLLS